ncbi:MAG: hypothetical protein ACRCZC_03730 [Culicoidibacterales bacterium]
MGQGRENAKNYFASDQAKADRLEHNIRVGCGLLEDEEMMAEPKV